MFISQQNHRTIMSNHEDFDLTELSETHNPTIGNLPLSAIKPKPIFSITTMDDQLKLDHLIKVWHKYSSQDLERLLPE